MLALPITKTDPYFLTSREIQVGNRRFVRDLCTSPALRDPHYQYYILFTLRGQCENASNLVEVHKAKYDDDTEGFTLYRQPTAAELLLRQKDDKTLSSNHRTPDLLNHRAP
jgi:hypothetical protein